MLAWQEWEDVFQGQEKKLGDRESFGEDSWHHPLTNLLN